MRLNDLRSDTCYIIVSEGTKTIYLWKGLRSSVRSKFIGVRRAQEVRDQMGAQYNITAIDEGDEDPEFLRLLGDFNQNDDN
ncbi:MAG: hypothetical protein ACFE88_13865 [Candidatus Hermodarchaeota archaeon]